MAKKLKPIRRPALTACLKKNKFVRAEWSDDDDMLYEVKNDDNACVRIAADEITVDIVTYKNFSMVPHETPAEEIVAYIEHEMALRAASVVAYDGLRADVLALASQLGVLGFWKRDEVDTHVCNFYTNAYKAEPLFYLAYAGAANKTSLNIQFEDYDVETADEVIKILQGSRPHQFWPSNDERIVFKGKSIITFKSHEDFVPFMFTHGVTSVIDRVANVQRFSTENADLNELVKDYPEPMHYTEIKLRRAITTEEFFEYIKKKTAELKMAGTGEFA